MHRVQFFLQLVDHLKGPLPVLIEDATWEVRPSGVAPNVDGPRIHPLEIVVVCLKFNCTYPQQLDYTRSRM